MHIIAVQPDIIWENPTATFAHVTSLLGQTKLIPGSLIVLPEMFASGFSMDVDLIAEKTQQPSLKFMQQLAADTRCTVLGGLVVKAANGRGINQAVAVNPSGQELVRYSKIHPFSFGNETKHYDPGTQVHTFEIANTAKPLERVTIAPLVCYDLRFPEIFRIAAARGARVMAVIANWPAPRHDHWTTLLKARAIENQAYVVGVNRAGSDPNVPYAGGSVIYDFKGNVLALADDKQGLLEADLDFASLEQYQNEFPALKDMRYRWSDDALPSS